nr:MAG TPA: hypothetical protein [Caudoviricetes sp.]
MQILCNFYKKTRHFLSQNSIYKTTKLIHLTQQNPRFS